MAPQLHRIYSDGLARTYQRGFPIANPQPVLHTDADGQRRLRSIDIGDVGFIQPEHGHFVFLLNVHLQPGINGQPSRDELPDGFVPLSRSTVMSVTDLTPSFVSQTVSVKKMNVAASGPFVGGFAGFETANKRGAILATPDPIEVHNAGIIESYRTYARHNIESWVEFARNAGCMIELEDLLLVTGTDRTTSWATAVFNDKYLDAGFGLEIQFASAGAGLQLACQYTWHNANSALVNAGPARPLIGSMPLDGPDLPLIHTSAEHCPMNTVSNQTLFIRHLRAKRRLPWLGLKLKAQGEKDREDNHDHDMDGDDGMGVDDHSSGIEVTSISARTKFTDSLDPILDCILENSDAEIAIAHHEDLPMISILTPACAPFLIAVRDGIGMLSWGGRLPRFSEEVLSSSGLFVNVIGDAAGSGDPTQFHAGELPVVREVTGYLPTPESSDTAFGRRRSEQRANDAMEPISRIQSPDIDEPLPRDPRLSGVSRPSTSHQSNDDTIFYYRSENWPFGPSSLESQHYFAQDTYLRTLTPPPDVPSTYRHHVHR